VKFFPLCLITIVLILAPICSAQTNPIDQSSSAGNAQDHERSPSSGEERPVSWTGLIPNILSDQQRIWTFPFHMIQRKEWKPVLGVVAATAALVALDPIDTPPLRRSTSFHSFNTVMSSRNTALFTGAVPGAFWVVGYLGKNSYATHTALLAGEAVADSEILATAMRTADHRLVPSSIPPHGNFADSWFEGRSGIGRGSFPSGHAVAAFSVATVISRRYGSHRWVPYVAYAAAGAIGFSRLTLSAHFPSDVFMGAALGYSISRFVVLQH
jgi:membrane-associated phospholipid phosphatase